MINFFFRDKVFLNPKIIVSEKILLSDSENTEKFKNYLLQTIRQIRFLTTFFLSFKFGPSIKNLLTLFYIVQK